MPVNLVAFYNRVVNSLSFTSDFYKLRRTLNSRIDSPESIEDLPTSHPAGFVKEFRRRRISIVESYLAILHYLESDRYPERIRALQLLQELTLHSKNLAMPLNTARVQLALMKEAVKSRENRRKQLELLQDFSVSSAGQPSMIRRYLDELGIIELPETGQRLADMGMGWDFHVHDNSSYGRKTPSQLVIDAFIKGISEITVAFNLLSGHAHLQELLQAGNALGVRVNFGVEFSAFQGDHRFHYMYLLPPMETDAELDTFFEAHGERLRHFAEGLRKNQQNRIETIRALIGNFNMTYLPIINEGYAETSVYYLKPLKIEDTDEIVPLDNLNRMHLGELLYQKYKPVLFKRVMLAKGRMRNALTQHREGEISQWDLSNITARYESLRQRYVDLNPENLRETYFSNPQIQDYRTVFTGLSALAETLHATGGKIKSIHPLEYGIDPAYSLILENCAHIDYVEVYNMHDSIERPVDDILRFAAFVNILNSGDPEAVKPFLVGHAISIDNHTLETTVTSVAHKSLIPVCGSDATGRSSSTPGMGFIFESALIGKHRKRYLEKHFALPELVSRIIGRCGSFVTEDDESRRYDRVISMGKTSKFQPNKIGDEYDTSPIPLGRAIRYLNPRLKYFFIAVVGFVVAYFTIGLGYALVWFAITSLRHTVTDLLSRRGPNLRDWTWKAVNFRNMANSLFWTGLSVPVLAFVKHEFDVLWPFATGTFFYNLVEFFSISFVNGFYLMGHNKLRGFDRSVMWGNLFRSIISWPFATVFAPLGNLALIPAIVQSKFWSDTVGGMIEGSGKFVRDVKLTRRDLTEIVKAFCQSSAGERYTAALDLLYIFERQPRGRNSLREILYGRENTLAFVRDLFHRRRAPKRQEFQEYETLAAWFDHQSNYHKLCDYIISSYRRDHMLLLVDLVAREYHRFNAWLASGRKSVESARGLAERGHHGAERTRNKHPVGRGISR